MLTSVKTHGDAFHSRRDLVVGLLRDIPGIKINVPEGAFLCISRRFIVLWKKHLKELYQRCQ
jgi:aspartate/methionine/tyrosine aminotransferase